MRPLFLAGLCASLCACSLRAPAVDPSQYVCPDGRSVWAGTSADGRLMRLTLEGRTYTLRRQGESYGNGYYTARLDQLFLHLHVGGRLLPLHCRLLPGPAHPTAVPAAAPPP